MKEIKREKIEEILHRLAAQFVREESTNASLITVTRVEMTPAGKVATIYFTTLPDSGQDTAEKFLDRKTPEFKHYVHEHSRLGIIPYLKFKIDYGERNRQRLDELGRGS
ncbi:ribosome-binding factor A [Candidatus Parcubacteria bacterium]|nr:ribosome-binding factor A [Candidatus Parcubacteria bacterium]